MNLEKINKLYNKFAVPAHIKKHMRQVARVAVAIGLRINQDQDKELVNIKLLRHASLLHDLLKVCDLKETDPIFHDKKYSRNQKAIWKKLIALFPKQNHVEAVSELLKKMGEHEIANVVKKHDYECVIDKKKSNRPDTLEEKIIYYADKRVLHDKVVDMTFRFNDGKKRYANEKISSAKRAAIEECAFEIEKELCRLAGIAPQELEELVV